MSDTQPQPSGFGHRTGRWWFRLELLLLLLVIVVVVLLIGTIFGGALSALKDYVPLFQTMLWIIVALYLVIEFRPQTKDLLYAIGQRILYGDFKFEGPGGWGFSGGASAGRQNKEPAPVAEHAPPSSIGASPRTSEAGPIPLAAAHAAESLQRDCSGSSPTARMSHRPPSTA